MTRTTLEAHIADRSSLLCVGLDPVLDKLPEGIPRSVDGITDFCRSIIDATLEYAVAYKPNLAFFECLGPAGMEAFAKTCEHVPATHFLIADAKRGDIGNTSLRYAEAFYQTYGCHGVTIAPYMGRDSVEPFLVEGHWAVLLALTSNSGSEDFEQQIMADGRPLWELVLAKASSWGHTGNMMFVTGATKAQDFVRIRELVPDHFLLVPGIGAQGGDLAAVLEHGLIAGGGLLINSSRSILYASGGRNYAQSAAIEARELRDTMARALQ